MHQRTTRGNAMATVPAQATDIPATPTPAQAVDTAPTAPLALNAQDTEMHDRVFDQPVAITAREYSPTMVTDPEPLGMQPPRPRHRVSSNSATAGQSSLTAETPHQPRTNWGKLREQAQRDRSKRRKILTAVNPGACFCCPRGSYECKPPDYNDDRKI
jgi:hypothetical protein